MKKILAPYHRQQNDYFCGPASLQMVFEYFGRKVSQEELALELKTNEERGSDHSRLIEVVRKYGFFCYVNNHSTILEIQHFIEKGLPIIINYIDPADDSGHYAVVVGAGARGIILNDPWDGKNFRLSRNEFLGRWHSTRSIHKEWIMVAAKDDFHLGKQYLPYIS